MEMPKPGKAHELLKKLAGSWHGDETMHPSQWDPKGGTAQGKINNRLALGGFAMVQDYEQIRDGKTTFEGHGVLSWDGRAREYIMHWWDSMGMPVNEFRGRLAGDKLTLIDRSPQMQHRTVWEITGDSSYSFTMEMSPDGERWTTLMTGTYGRGA